MPTAGPAYLRTADDDNYSGLFAEPSLPKDEAKLHVTGLREKSLLILLISMTLLSIISLVILGLNIYLIQTLRMTHRGMKHIQFHTRQDSKTGLESKVLRFVADSMHLGKVVSRTGHVYGSPNSDLNIQGSRVIIKGSPNGSRFLLQDGECKFENVDQFFTGDEDNPYFSAKYPRFNIDERIKRISTKEIATDKIRSPTKKNLNVVAENMALRGMEGIQLVADNVTASAETRIVIRPTDAESHLNLDAMTINFGAFPKKLPISKSPLLEASIDAYRLCICNGYVPKLFAVAGNRECKYIGSFCK